MPRLLPVVALAAALVACATGPRPPAPPVPMTEPPSGGPVEFSPKGEVSWKDLTGVSAPRRVSFDDWRVKGPTVSLARSSDGRGLSWTAREEETPDPEKDERFLGARVGLQYRQKFGENTTFDNDTTANMSLADQNDWSSEMTNSISGR